jgi:DNA-binding beta-propeller fold protein YncE
MTNNTLAVVSQSGETLSFFNATTGEYEGQLTNLRPEPHELAYDSQTNLLYITHAYAHGWYPAHGENGREITIVDCGTRQGKEIIDISPAQGPHYLVLDRAHDLLYCSVEGGLTEQPNSGGLIAIDLDTYKLVKSIESGYKTHWFVMTPNGRKAYTCNKDANFVSVLDLEQESMVLKIDMPVGCEQPAISKDGKYAYFPTPTIPVALKRKPGEFSIEVIDTETDRIVKVVPMDFPALNVHVDSKDRLLLGQYRFDFGPDPVVDDGKHKLMKGEPHFQNGRLLIIDPQAKGVEKRRTVEVGTMPLTVFASPDRKRAFASNILDGTVTVVDMERLSVERTLEVDVTRRKDKGMHQGAHGLALIP